MATKRNYPIRRRRPDEATIHKANLGIQNMARRMAALRLKTPLFRVVWDNGNVEEAEDYSVREDAIARADKLWRQGAFAVRVDHLNDGETILRRSRTC